METYTCPAPCIAGKLGKQNQDGRPDHRVHGNRYPVLARPREVTANKLIDDHFA
jgi:hypothetical protein